MFERQTRGIISISIFLALIPLVFFLTSFQRISKDPILSLSDPKSLIVEVVAVNGESGIYFVEPGTSMNQMFSQIGLKGSIAGNIKIQNGMRVRLIPEGDRTGIVIEQMDAAKRLAMGLPLDINLASMDELALIPGIGYKLAADIVAEREKNGRFEDINQLISIDGIKEKKFSKLRLYLYVDRTAQ